MRKPGSSGWHRDKQKRDPGRNGNEKAGKSTKIEWLKPVYADDVLTGTAAIIKTERRNAGNGLAEVSIVVRNRHGDVVLTNVTEAIVKCRPAE